MSNCLLFIISFLFSQISTFFTALSLVFNEITVWLYESIYTLTDISKDSNFFYTQFKSFYKDELPKTLLTTHFTILQRRYPEEHDNLTTPTPFHKRHRTKLKLNIRLQKATYNQFTDNWHRIKEACFAVDVELTNSIKKNLEERYTEPMLLVGFGYWRSAVTQLPDIQCGPDSCIYV